MMMMMRRDLAPSASLSHTPPFSHPPTPSDPQVDVYSFAIVLSELDTHLIPYTNHSKISLTRRFATARVMSEGWSFCRCYWCDLGAFSSSLPPPIPIGLRPEVSRACPEAIVALMKTCWSTDPSERPEFGEIVSCRGSTVE